MELMEMQMHYGAVIRFIICFCLVGFAVAKCVPEKCGGMELSYPFWINNSECGYSSYFQIKCIKDKDTGNIAPFLPVEVANGNTTLERTYYKIWDIDYSGYIVINSSSLKASSCGGNGKADAFKKFLLPGPFYFSMSDKFVVVGCNTTGRYNYGNTSGQATCLSSCYAKNTTHYPKDPTYCRYGCCEITVPENYWGIKFSTGTDSDGTCGFSTLMDTTTFTFLVDNKTDPSWEDLENAHYGLRLNWGIGRKNCSMAKNRTFTYSCDSNAECINSPSTVGHVCKCRSGFEGNGYSNGTGCIDINQCISKKNNTCVEAKRGGICHNVPGYYKCSCAEGYEGDGYSNSSGCTDIDECHKTNGSLCVEEEKGGICQNLAGSYNCSCATGYNGDGFRNGTSCKPEKSNKIAMFAALGSVSTFVVVSLGGCAFFWWVRRHYQKRARKENFKINGGDFLMQILPTATEGKKFKIFSENELRKASQNYADGMKLGSGSSGMVYKGVLADGRAVAIKKFREFCAAEENEESLRPFLNEIVTLWSLNHENIVSLVGCCLETPSPLLVYEFVDGGTIFQQLHSGSLPWQSRLQIAMGSADALAYLHSLDHPIIHRDVKSSNILLEKSYHTPKVADFGMSRLLCGNDAHLNTNVVSTCGYMDPGYFGTGVLNDKSDVYSFGVFLAELLTGQKPLSNERPQQDMLLANLFLSKCDDNRLSDILDPKIKEGTKEDEVNGVAGIARECLLPEGSKRPSMIQVQMRLRGIVGSTGDV